MCIVFIDWYITGGSGARVIDWYITGGSGVYCIYDWCITIG